MQHIHSELDQAIPTSIPNDEYGQWAFCAVCSGRGAWKKVYRKLKFVVVSAAAHLCARIAS